MLETKLYPIPVLETERIVLRPVNAGDAEALFTLRSSREAMRFIQRPIMASVPEAEEMIVKILEAAREGTGITWAVCLRQSNRLIGTMGFWRMVREHYRAEIGYMLHPQWHGMGIMNEAMQLALDHAFSSIGLHSVEANVNPGNHASVKLLLKHKFVKEGYFRESYFHDGKFFDSEIYSRLK